MRAEFYLARFFGYLEHLPFLLKMIFPFTLRKLVTMYSTPFSSTINHINFMALSPFKTFVPFTHFQCAEPTAGRVICNIYRN